MTHYKIASNGKKFRIKQWNWFWPFWVYVYLYRGDGSIAYEAEWKSLDDAEAWIRSELHVQKTEALPWRDL